MRVDERLARDQPPTTVISADHSLLEGVVLVSYVPHEVQEHQVKIKAARAVAQAAAEQGPYGRDGADPSPQDAYAREAGAAEASASVAARS